MADDKGATIIIKRIKKAGHGAHGGAWKVAYADFVTAMMAFFMVMWLLGSDDETKAAVSHYFNNPTSAWRKDLVVKETSPLGDMTGAGENVVNGAQGQTPDDLVERPMRPVKTSDIESSKPGDVLEQFMSDESLASLDMIRFSIAEDQIFKTGTTDAWTGESEKFLKKLGSLLRKYKGKVQIRGTYARGKSDSPVGSYEFQMSRIVAVAKYTVDNQWAREDQITTYVTESKRDPAMDETPPRRLEFTLTRSEK